ncbi:MAG: hypothetical protein ACOYBL_08860 [Lachnospiraceae bacterium]|jgi:DNA-directed RNA polymerase specialized sigma24 family protein
MEEILNRYYENNARKLHKVVNSILSKFGGIADKDYHDFYSLANEVFVDVMKKYDYEQSFDGFLYSCLSKKIRTEITRRNRIKRLADRNAVSIDTSVNEDNSAIGDLLPASSNVEEEIFDRRGVCEDEKIEQYFNSLSKIQREILELKMKDVPVCKIKEILSLTDKQYESHCAEMKSFKNISVLYTNETLGYLGEDKRMNVEESITQTMENCKTDKISIASIIKRIDRHMIRFDHPLQRESDQWSPSMKGNLISDILQGNKLHPLIFAEQIINGVPIIWDLDGKQRCTNAYSFAKNGYKISRNIRRWMIQYQTIKKGENGDEILDSNGFPIAVNAEFDIRGKRFTDLPEELQDRFLDYGFNYDQYLNCSEEDIAYHIERYNDGKPMTTSQKGITKLGTEYAEIVKSISSMPFFKDMGGYKVSEFKNGAIYRVVVESIMATNYLEDWKKKQEDMCRYIKNNATVAEFDSFEDMIERLEKVMTDDVSDMFDSRDSFIWFGLFARFIKIGINDEKFIDFMTEFTRSLHGTYIDHVSFDDLNRKSTKDKNVVIGKMNHLEKLMYQYLGMDQAIKNGKNG